MLGWSYTVTYIVGSLLCAKYWKHAVEAEHLRRTLGASHQCGTGAVLAWCHSCQISTVGFLVECYKPSLIRSKHDLWILILFYETGIAWCSIQLSQFTINCPLNYNFVITFEWFIQWKCRTKQWVCSWWFANWRSTLGQCQNRRRPSWSIGHRHPLPGINEFWEIYCGSQHLCNIKLHNHKMPNSHCILSNLVIFIIWSIRYWQMTKDMYSFVTTSHRQFVALNLNHDSDVIKKLMVFC